LYQLLTNYSKCFKEYTNQLQQLLPFAIRLGFDHDLITQNKVKLEALTTIAVSRYVQSQVVHTD